MRGCDFSLWATGSHGRLQAGLRCAQTGSPGHQICRMAWKGLSNSRFSDLRLQASGALLDPIFRALAACRQRPSEANPRDPWPSACLPPPEPPREHSRQRLSQVRALISPVSPQASPALLREGPVERQPPGTRSQVKAGGAREGGPQSRFLGTHRTATATPRCGNSPAGEACSRLRPLLIPSRPQARSTSGSPRLLAAPTPARDPQCLSCSPPSPSLSLPVSLPSSPSLNPRHSPLPRWSPARSPRLRSRPLMGTG